MNAKKLIAAVAVFAAAGSALADDTTYPYVDHSKFVSTKTRAEVVAELEKDYAEGNYAYKSSSDFVEYTNVASNKTRDEVRNEAIQAAKLKQGKSDATGG